MLVGQDCLLDILGYHGYSITLCFEVRCFKAARNVVLAQFGDLDNHRLHPLDAQTHLRKAFYLDPRFEQSASVACRQTIAG